MFALRGKRETALTQASLWSILMKRSNNLSDYSRFNADPKTTTFSCTKSNIARWASCVLTTGSPRSNLPQEAQILLCGKYTCADNLPGGSHTYHDCLKSSTFLTVTIFLVTYVSVFPHHNHKNVCGSTVTQCNFPDSNRLSLTLVQFLTHQAQRYCYWFVICY